MNENLKYISAPPRSNSVLNSPYAKNRFCLKDSILGGKAGMCMDHDPKGCALSYFKVGMLRALSGVLFNIALDAFRHATLGCLSDVYSLYQGDGSFYGCCLVRFK